MDEAWADWEYESQEPKHPYYREGYVIPERIVMCESGGDWHALNPSGAGGAYQIMPETFHAYGGSGEPQNASPAEQNAVAARLYAAEGTSPWVASEGCWG